MPGDELRPDSLLSLKTLTWVPLETCEHFGAGTEKKGMTYKETLKDSAGPLGYLGTHGLWSGCPAASYPSVPCKYVHPGPGCPPHHAVEVGRSITTAAP